MEATGTAFDFEPSTLNFELPLTAENAEEGWGRQQNGD
jgi:hypothetical protein